MSGKNQEFVVNSQKIRKPDSELLGDLGAKYALLPKSPNAFFITTAAFDTFLLATELADEIQSLLENVRLNMFQENQEIAKRISELIMAHDMPQIIVRPIEQAYRTLVQGNNAPLVKVKPSTLVPTKFQSDNYKRISHTYVSGLETLLQTIKLAWSTLFIAEELEERIKTYYKGDLSCAVIIQEFLHPEVSGQIKFDKDKAEVTACFGIDEALENSKEISDVYQISEGRVHDKTINNQSKMFVRNINLKDNFFLPVNVSAEQKSKQKLSDNLIQKIADDAVELNKIAKNDFIVKYVVEAGELSYTDLIFSFKDIEPTLKTVKHEKIEVDPSAGDIDLITEEIFETVKSEAETKEKKEAETAIPEAFNIKEEKNKLRTKINILIQHNKPTDLILGKAFDGVVIDGTAIVKKYEKLPDDVLANPKKLRELSEKYSHDVLTFGKSFKNNEIYYAMSDIYSQKTETDGDLRFLYDNKIFYTELLAVQLAESEFNVAINNFIFTGVRSIENYHALMESFKKLHFSKKHKKKILIEIANPSILLELEELDENVDGVVINISKLLQGILNISDVSKIKDTQLNKIVRQLTLLKGKVDIMLYSSFMDERILEEMFKLEPSSFLINKVPDIRDLRLIKSFEKDSPARLVTKLS